MLRVSVYRVSTWKPGGVSASEMARVLYLRFGQSRRCEKSNVELAWAPLARRTLEKLGHPNGMDS